MPKTFTNPLWFEMLTLILSKTLLIGFRVSRLVGEISRDGYVT